MGIQRFPTPSRGEGRGRCHPGPRRTYNGLQGASSSRGEREKGYGGRGTREGQAGRRWALTSSALPPCSCKAFCKSSTWARSSNSCCWFSLQECGATQCPRPPSAPASHAPSTRPLGGPPPPGGSSPQLRLQPVARAVGLLQVALQLLLPLPVGRLLLAQLLVLQLKPQERLPADRGREQGWRPVPLQACPGSGRETGRTGLQRDSAPGKGLAGPWSGLGVLGTQRRGTQNGRGLELG